MHDPVQVVEQGTNMSSAHIAAMASSQVDHTPVSVPNQGMFQLSNDQRSMFEQRGVHGVSQMEHHGTQVAMHDESAVKTMMKTPVITSFVKYAGSKPMAGINEDG